MYAQYNNPLPVWIICHKPTNLYLHQFSAISGGNCIIEPRQSGWAGWPDLWQGAADRGVGVELPCGYEYSGCWPSGEQAGVERVTPAHRVCQASCSKVPRESSAIPS